MSEFQADGNLEDSVDAIASFQDLAVFIQFLLADLRQNEGDWENPNLSRYLEALAEIVSSTETVERNLGRDAPPRPSWRIFGEYLLAARYYE